MADILMEVKNRLKEKINQAETKSIETDGEFYFAVGQLTSYFISLSKAKIRPHSLANPVINATKATRIKDELKKFYMKYNHDISFNRRFNNLYAMVASYVPSEEGVQQDTIIAGYLHSSLVYEK